MRILYVGGFEMPDRNAAAQRVLANAKAMRAIGHDVRFVGITHCGDFHGTVDGFEYDSKPYPRSIKSWLRHLCRFTTCKDLDFYSPDLVVAYNFPAVSLKHLVKICHKRNIMVVGDITEWYTPVGKSLHSFLLKCDVKSRMKTGNKMVDGLIGISNFLCDYYRNDVPVIRVTPLVDIEDEKWHRNRELTAGSPIRLVFAGTFGASKDLLIPIIEAVNKSSNLHLTIVGATNSDIPANVTTKNVSFTGRLPHKEALTILSQSDFQIFYREDNITTRAGFPTKFVESMTVGLPVITSLTSDLAEYLRDGENGFVIHSADDIPNVLNRVAKLTPEKIIDMKKKCLSINDFDYRIQTEAFESLFKTIRLQ